MVTCFQRNVDISAFNDGKIVSDFRPALIDGECYVRVKRSKYCTRIPNLNEDIAYLSGIIAGDGSFKMTSRTGSYPRVAIVITNKSVQFLKDIDRLVEENFHYPGRIYERNGGGHFDYRINNKIIFLYFRRVVGIDKKRAKLHIPKKLLTGKFLRFFLAGLFDTDGYFSEDTFGIMLNARNYSLLLEIKTNLCVRGLYFGNICRNTLIVDGRPYYRIIMRLRKKSVAKFRKFVPLKHEKYMGPQGIGPRVFPA